MPGRKNPKETESEKKREYRLASKRGGLGEHVVGNEAAWLDEQGAVGEIARKREAWEKEHGGR